VLPKDESLTPGIIYVLIAGLSGSVLTRTRAFPVRWLTPPVFALAAMPYFLPKTSHNLRNYLSDVEDKYVPELAQRHDSVNAGLSNHWEMLKDRLGSASQKAEGWGNQAVRGIESSTGLRVGDAIKKGQEKVEQQRQKMEGGIRMPAEGVKVQTVGYVVETKPVAEIVAPVSADGSSKNAINAKAAVERPLVVPAPSQTQTPSSSPLEISPVSPIAPVAVVETPAKNTSKPKADEGKRLV
jgi:organizing structure protein 2